MAFHIIFPCGDKSKISVVEIDHCISYEINDYSVASRREFHDNEEAVKYAIELATLHNLVYVGDDDGYLD